MLKHLKAQAGDDKGVAEKGFTRVELLVVIVILGILAGVVVFAISGISDKDSTSACKAEARTVERALESYNDQFGAYPTGTTGLIPRFLESAPENVDVSGGGGTVRPTLKWIAGPSKCSTDSDLDATP